VRAKVRVLSYEPANRWSTFTEKVRFPEPHAPSPLVKEWSR
jgi:hypothetical protein